MFKKQYKSLTRIESFPRNGRETVEPRIRHKGSYNLSSNLRKNYQMIEDYKGVFEETSIVDTRHARKDSLNEEPIIDKRNVGEFQRQNLEFINHKKIQN